MGETGVVPFSAEGNVNPAWLAQINNDDVLVSEISSYFLSGEKLKAEIKCMAAECVMQSRGGSYVNKDTSKTEYSPMMLCFYCDRTFHTGCMDLDSFLIREETVPWRCKDCKKDLQNKHCQDYYNQTKYKLSLINRRKKLLLQAFLPEKEKTFQKEVEFLKSDIVSFERRAVQLLAEEDPDSVADVSAITPLLLKKTMKSRADKKATQESAERFRLELEKRDLRIKQLEEASKRYETAANMTVLEDSTLQTTMQGSPSFSGVPSSSMLQSTSGGARAATNLLTGLYTERDRTAEIEKNNFRYSPQSIMTASRVNETTVSGSTQNSSQISIDPNDLTSLVTQLTIQQERKDSRNQLIDRRKALPKMTEFNGEDSKWLAFKQDVERYRHNCKYDDEAVKLFMKGALKGEAFNLVSGLFDKADLDSIMATLKLAYGDEMRIIRRRSEELKNFKFNSAFHRSDAVKLIAAIQSYFSACEYAGIGYLNTNSIAEAIFTQLNAEDRQRCKMFYQQKYPANPTIIMDVQTIYDYVLQRMPLLDDVPAKKKSYEPDHKPKSKSFNSYSVNSSSPSDGYKFDIKDKAKAPYLGYDLEKLSSINKECRLCHSKEHYTVQCPIFKGKSESERLKSIIDSKLCKNCVVTTAHRAMDCDLKSSCGFKVDKTSRCCSKHHISIHGADSNAQSSSRGRNSYKKRFSNTKKNTVNASEKMDAIKEENKEPAANVPTTTGDVNFHALDPTVVKRKYEVCSVGDKDSDIPRTVKMFKVNFYGPKGRVTAFAVGDSGSEVTWMRDDLREALGISGTPHNLQLTWADRSTKDSVAIQFDMEIQGTYKGARKYKMNKCFASQDLNLPSRSLDMNELRKKFPYLKNVPFEGYRDEQPVILIGSPHAYLIEGCELVEGNGSGPVAVRTKIGWSVYGGMTHEMDPRASIQAVSETSEENEEIAESEVLNELLKGKFSNEELHKLLVQHFSIESLGVRAIQTHQTLKEKRAVELIEKEMRILSDGSVECPLIWNVVNDSIPRLPNNYSMALQRRLTEERKLQRNPELMEIYNVKFKELLDLKFFREANEKDMKGNWPNVWYLPTSIVLNENKVPPKARLVYDASCSYKGESLNQNLLKGPDLLVNILQPLIKMRMNEIAFTADVKSMFNMVKICKRDQQAQRVLFREKFDMPMKTYIANVMLFGPTSSPFTSQYVKNKTAEKFAYKYPEAAETLIKYTYMDDVLTSEPNIAKAKQVAENCIEICKSINWQLVSFQSNSVELLKLLPPDAVKKDAIPFPESDTESYVTKVLGCFWNTTDDCFEFKLQQNLFIQLVKDFDQMPTKRDQASTLARIYDVLGLISHFTIIGKILLQRSWANKTGWDEKIDEKLARDWKKWLEQLNYIEKMKFPRRFAQIDSLRNAKEIQLHIFSDAGAEAFGAVAYLVVKTERGTDSSLVMAKAKVTPLRLKTETQIKEMPRLELMAALLAARLCRTISNITHGIKFEKNFWCDSEVVLRWIKNPNQKLLKYAIGPVEEILDVSERNEWKFVPTDLNVADLCTKMKKLDFSSSETIWMYGPTFIKEDQESWPKQPEKFKEDDYVMANNIYQEKLNYSTHKLPPVDCPIANDVAIDRFRASIRASWTKLVRGVARALKLHIDAFIPVVRHKQFNNASVISELSEANKIDTLDLNDLERAEHFIFRKIQREEFEEEYKALSNGKPIKNPMMQQLNVFMDPEGIIRINARVNRNDEDYPQQFSPLLPRKNVIVTSLLAYYHYKYKHIAIESQIAEIRSKVWIPQLRTALRSIKARCNWCVLVNAKPYAPIMAPLPNDRVNPGLKPFEVTGVDVLGPLRPTVNGNIKKIYILIFTCTLTRYIHLHILDSLESLRVLEAIVVFWTSYGPVRKFVSDNGTNFKKTARLLEEDYEKAQFMSKQPSILGPKLSEMYRVEWQFIAVHAPWFGGMYERLIREVKRSLSATLDRKKINKIELNIAVHEACHRVNCRPLTENSLDAADGEILTPHHLVKNKSGWPLLPGIHKNTYSVAPDRLIYRRGRIAADEIMRKFTAQYLPVLTKRTKWHKNERPPKVGDLVLLIEPNNTRREWQRAKIVKIHAGRDKVVRVADVEMPNGTVKKNRALRNLAKLNLTKDLNDDSREGSLTVIQDSNEKTAVQLCTVFQNFESCQNSSAANFKNIYSTENSDNNKINYLNLIQMQAKNENKSHKLLQLDGVAADMKLSEVVREIQTELESIVGIYRIFDYVAERGHDSIVLMLMDAAELSAAMKGRFEINSSDGVKISFPQLTVGSAYFMPSFVKADENIIKGCPKPVGLFNLPKLSQNTSEFIATLLEAFEPHAEITGFRFCLNETGKHTRSFGFVHTLRREQALDLTGRKFIVSDREVEAKITNSVTIFVRPEDKYLLNDGRKAFLTQKMVDANWVCAKCPEEIPTGSNTVMNSPESTETLREESLDDSIVLTLEDSERFETEELDLSASLASSLLPSCDIQKTGSSSNVSRTVVMNECSDLIVTSSTLQERPTVALSSPKRLRNDENVSRYLRLIIMDQFKYQDFERQLKRYIRNYEIVLLFVRPNRSAIFIEFIEKYDAQRFKNFVEVMQAGGDAVEVDYAEEGGPLIIESARGNQLKIAKDETMFAFDKSGGVRRTEHGNVVTVVTSAPLVCRRVIIATKMNEFILHRIKHF